MMPGFEGINDWSFTRPNLKEDVDRYLFRYFAWERVKVGGHMLPSDRLANCALVLAYQPGWILSPQDLLQFIHTSRVST